MAKNGVEYITKNNKEEQRITKYATASSSLSGQASGLKVNVNCGFDPTEEENDSSQVLLRRSTPLCEDRVKRAMVQLWDNGEQSRQRYKFKVRLNLADGTDVDFIAPLTKDPRNFIQYTHDRELARTWRDISNRNIRQQFGVRPWLGKFHMVQSAYGSRYHKQVIEPNCFATVWWDDDVKEWSATYCIYDFHQEEVDLQRRNITVKQQQQGCRGSRLWINPRFDTQPRPMTWAETQAVNRSK